MMAAEKRIQRRQPPPPSAKNNSSSWSRVGDKCMFCFGLAGFLGSLFFLHMLASDHVSKGTPTVGDAPNHHSRRIAALEAELSATREIVQRFLNGKTAEAGGAVQDDGSGIGTSVSTAIPSSTSSQHEKKKQRFDLLPVVVLDNPPFPADAQRMLLDSMPRITLRNINHTLVGPFRAFYPSSKHTVIQDWLQNKATDITKNPKVITFQQINDTESKRQVLKSKTFWKGLSQIATKVLIMDPASVLCGNPTTALLEYLDHDWIGAAWKWASPPESVHHRGGNGAFSIRSPRHLVALLESELQPETSNEDMWFVRKLGEWAESGDVRNGIAPPKLASWDAQQAFAVEEIASPRDITPVGVFHLMRTMDFRDRERTLSKCPESKLLFTPLHEPKCAILQCPKNMTIDVYPWEQMVRDGTMDKCTDICNVLYHPVAAALRETVIPDK